MSWYYRTAGTVQGPIERDGLVNLLRNGTLTPQVEVSEDSATWMMAPQVPGLMAEVLGSSTGTAPAPPSPQPSAPSPSALPANTALAGPNSMAPAPAPAQPSIPTEASTSAAIAPPAQTIAPETARPAEPTPQAPPVAQPEPEETRPSGPVGHITIDPSKRSNRKSKDDGNPSPLKLAICGLIGIAVLGSAGLFGAYKLFGFDPRPARVDSSVSKFMIESPELVAHLDVKKLMDSTAFNRSPFRQQISSSPFASYAHDVTQVTFALDKLDLTNPKYIAIVELERDYRAEFVANFFRNAQVEDIGSKVMHIDPSSLTEVPTAVCLADPRLLLIGSPGAIRDVILRDAHPKLYPRESDLVASTTGSDKVMAVTMLLDSAKKAFLKNKKEGNKQLKKMDKKEREAVKEMLSEVKKTFDDVEYALKNIRSAHFTVKLGDSITVTTQAECGSKWKAKKVMRAFNRITANAPGGMSITLGTSTLPEVKGSVVEYHNHIDLSELDDFGSMFTSTGF